VINLERRKECAVLIFPILYTPALSKGAPASEMEGAQSGSEPIVLELLDAWRGRQPDYPSRAEAIERLIAIGWAPETRRWI
jgi:hypothetical protein